MWKNCGTARQTADNKIRRMHFASWITKATDTHSECVILIAFPRQHWLRERVSILLLGHVHCVSCFNYRTTGLYLTLDRNVIGPNIHLRLTENYFRCKFI